MRRAKVLVNGVDAGILEEAERGTSYIFRYREGYQGAPVSLTMPTNMRIYSYGEFPPFFEGVLPEGVMLDGLLRREKIDKTDLFSQLLTVGRDLVGAVTVEEIT